MARAIGVEGHRLIRAPVQRVWHLLSRLESHPRYITLWMAADVHERSLTTATVEFRGFFGGLPIVSAQRITLRPPGRIDFRQIRGELRDLSGAYLLKEVDGETDLTVQLSVDAGIPLFSEASVQQILVGHIDGTLTRVKASAERDLVRLPPRRSRAADVGGPAPESSAVTDEPDRSAADDQEGAWAQASEDLASKSEAAAIPVSAEGTAAGPAETARGVPATGGRVAATAEEPGSGHPTHGSQRRGRRRRRRRGRGREGGRAPRPAAGEVTHG